MQCTSHSQCKSHSTTAQVPTYSALPPGIGSDGTGSNTSAVGVVTGADVVGATLAALQVSADPAFRTGALPTRVAPRTVWRCTVLYSVHFTVLHCAVQRSLHCVLMRARECACTQGTALCDCNGPGVCSTGIQSRSRGIQHTTLHCTAHDLH